MSHHNTPKTITNSIGMELVNVPAGEFVMGTDCIPNATPDCRENETLPRRVKLTSFYMGKYEVTQAQWYAVMRTTPWYFSPAKVVGGGDTVKHPVEQVSWNDVQDFIKKLNQLDKDKGYVYRLPTEAEWEYAARGGTQTDYLFGDTANDKLGEYAWFSENSGNQTHPVGQLKANPFGLYDILGNVWEWTASDYAPYATNAALEISNKTNENKSLRGCGWYYYSNSCRVAFRFNSSPSVRGNFGFRLVAEVSP